jgi:hypothetical protein
MRIPILSWSGRGGSEIAKLLKNGSPIVFIVLPAPMRSKIGFID